MQKETGQKNIISDIGILCMLSYQTADKVRYLGFILFGDLQELVPYLIIIADRELMDPRYFGYSLDRFRRRRKRYLQNKTASQRYKFRRFESYSAFTYVFG